MQQPLASRVRSDADPAQIAAAFLAVWQEIAAVLAPIVGEQGLAALYRRTVHQSMSQHPWLSGRDEGLPTETEPAALATLIARQSPSDAAAAGDAFLLSFQALLASLIGPSLTARLLRSVWDNPSSGTAAQDTSP